MTRRLCTWLLILALLVPASSLLAQGGGSAADRVRTDLERTDQLIERATDLIQASENPAGATLLDHAKDLQLQAWASFNANQLVAARRLTLAARDVLRRALSTSRQAEQNDGLVLRHLDRAGEMLDRASDVVSNAGNDNLAAIYQSARDNLSRAWEFYRNKQYRPALKLADQAETAAEKILQLQGSASAAGGDTGEETYQRRKDNVAQSVEQARQMVANCNSRPAQDLVNQADKAVTLAEDLTSRGATQAALQSLQRAREMAARAVRLCGGSSQLQERHDHLQNQADQLKEKAAGLTGQMKDAADRLIDQSFEQLRLAAGFIRDGQTDRASAALQAAQLALRQAQSYIR